MKSLRLLLILFIYFVGLEASAKPTLVNVEVHLDNDCTQSGNSFEMEIRLYGLDSNPSTLTFRDIIFDFYLYSSHYDIDISELDWMTDSGNDLFFLGNDTYRYIINSPSGLELRYDGSQYYYTIKRYIRSDMIIVLSSAKLGVEGIHEHNVTVNLFDLKIENSPHSNTNYSPGSIQNDSYSCPFLDSTNMDTNMDTNMNGNSNVNVVNLRTITGKESNNVFYPNPVQDILNIEVAEDKTLQIINSTGKIILQRSIRKGKDVIHLEQLVSGMYFISFCGENRKENYKLVKQ